MAMECVDQKFKFLFLLKKIVERITTAMVEIAAGTFWSSSVQITEITSVSATTTISAITLYVPNFCGGSEPSYTIPFLLNTSSYPVF